MHSTHSFSDYNIAKKLSQFTSVRDEQTMTQYAYNQGSFLSFDDERSICDKTEYAMNNDLYGFIIWELSGDVMDDRSTPLLDAVVNRLSDPMTPCDPDAPSLLETSSVDYWYPHQTSGICIRDGKQPNYFTADQLFVSNLPRIVFFLEVY